MRHVLILRQQEEGDVLAKIIEENKDIPYVFPLFQPQFLPLPLLPSAQGIIITSKNALRALHHSKFTTSLPLYCVGDKTAEFAKSLGFSNVLSASGNKQDLVNLIQTHALPTHGDLIYCSGDVIKDGLIETLHSTGFMLKRCVVYTLIPIPFLPPSLLSLLSEGILSHILLFSPHTTSLFLSLLKKSDLDNTTSRMTSLCLSPDVVKEAKTVAWKKIWTSPYPTVAAMMDYFNAKT